MATARRENRAAFRLPLIGGGPAVVGAFLPSSGLSVAPASTDWVRHSRLAATPVPEPEPHSNPNRHIPLIPTPRGITSHRLARPVPLQSSRAPLRSLLVVARKTCCGYISRTGLCRRFFRLCHRPARETRSGSLFVPSARGRQNSKQRPPIRSCRPSYTLRYQLSRISNDLDLREPVPRQHAAH